MDFDQAVVGIASQPFWWWSTAGRWSGAAAHALADRAAHVPLDNPHGVAWLLGSLREAVEASGPRTAVFRVGGVIALKSKLVVRNPYLTVAGQTAPGDGICVKNYTFGCSDTHDVIIRHVRIRLGDLLPLVAMAQRLHFVWLQDFLDDEVMITPDLYEVLRAFRCTRPSA